MSIRAKAFLVRSLHNHLDPLELLGIIYQMGGANVKAGTEYKRHHPGPTVRDKARTRNILFCGNLVAMAGCGQNVSL